MLVVISSLLLFALYGQLVVVQSKTYSRQQIYEDVKNPLAVPQTSPSEVMKRQAYQTYLMDAVNQLDRQMVQNPRTLEERLYNYDLQRQRDKVSTILEENEFIFGLKPYLRIDADTSTISTTSGGGGRAGTGAGVAGTPAAAIGGGGGAAAATASPP